MGKKLKMKYVEADFCTGEGVQESFMYITMKIFNEMEKESGTE